MRGVMMSVLAFAAGVSLAIPAEAQTVAACTGGCARLAVSDAQIPAGGTGSVTVSFEQAPSDGDVGGPDEIAAIAFSLNIPGDDSRPLTLADCSLAGGVPQSVRLNGALSNFRVVVENATCDGGKTHCLCPSSGTPDNFINLVVYGPNPLPTPGPGPIDIPVIPSGPLLTIDLKADSGSAGATVPLHIVNEVEDAERPASRAFLSIGDREAVDQTCVPIPGTPPCNGPSPVSQITTDDGSVSIGDNVPSCVGDCGGDDAVTVDEIITMVNIALGTNTVDACSAGDSNDDDQITVDEIVSALNKALNGC